jgi:hypothetical protein
MLAAFLSMNREEIIARTVVLRRATTRVPRGWATRATDIEMQDIIPSFVDQLTDALGSPLPTRASSTAPSATERDGDLRQVGLRVDQIVRDYAGLCQAMMELAAERKTSITPEEFQILIDRLDDAIARAITEFRRQRTQVTPDLQSLRALAHELRNHLNIAVLALTVLKTANVGATEAGATLDRSMRAVSDLVERNRPPE